MTTRGKISSLPDDQRAQIDRWRFVDDLGYSEIRARVQRAYGVTVSATSLSNYFSKRHLETSRDIILFDSSETPSLNQWVILTAKLLLSLRSRPPHRAKQLQTLAASYREKLSEKRMRIQRSRKKWRYKKAIEELPEFSQRKAHGVKLALGAYYTAIDVGLPPGCAADVARLTWLLLLGKAISRRSVRRLIDRLETRGGPDLAPIEAYADGKSVRHRCKTRAKESSVER